MMDLMWKAPIDDDRCIYCEKPNPRQFNYCLACFHVMEMDKDKEPNVRECKDCGEEFICPGQYCYTCAEGRRDIWRSDKVAVRRKHESEAKVVSIPEPEADRNETKLPEQHIEITSETRDDSGNSKVRILISIVSLLASNLFSCQSVKQEGRCSIKSHIFLQIKLHP